MTHTKEPWKVFYTRDGVHVLGIGDKDAGGITGANGGLWRSDPERKANAERIVSCVNALANLNPEAVADVVAALEAIRKTMDGYRSQMKFCDVEALGYFREFDRRIDASGFRTALTRIRGEGA